MFLGNHSIFLLNWNVNFRSADLLVFFDSLSVIPDIVCLQEVRAQRSEAFINHFKKLGLVHCFFSGRPDSSEKYYGNIIASHWPLQSLPLPKSPLLKWPQLIAHVKAEAPCGPVEVLNVHIPNGSNNGWAKVDTFDYLADLLMFRDGQPLVLTGDFNEPQYVLQDGRIVTFGQRRLKDGRYIAQGMRKGGERSHWDQSVRWFFEGEGDHGLRHALWDKKGEVCLETTHITRGEPRWFDHAFVSSHFRVVDFYYDHQVRTQSKLSDHSALCLELEKV